MSLSPDQKDRMLLDLLMLRTCIDDLDGFEPSEEAKSSKDVEKIEQRGWQNAVMNVFEQWGALSKWVKTLTPEQSQALIHLQAHSALFTQRDGDNFSLYLLLNDTFFYASADAEEVLLDDLPELSRLWSDYGYVGAVAWAANKRKDEPLAELKTPLYEKAKRECARSKTILKL